MVDGERCGGAIFGGCCLCRRVAGLGGNKAVRIAAEVVRKLAEMVRKLTEMGWEKWVWMRFYKRVLCALWRSAAGWGKLRAACGGGKAAVQGFGGCWHVLGGGGGS